MKSHTSGIPLAEFNKNCVARKARVQSALRYLCIQPHVELLLFLHLSKIRIQRRHEWLKTPQKPGWKFYDRVAGKAAGGIQVGDMQNVLVVRYEDLISKNKKAKVEALQSIVNFIGLPLDNSLLDALSHFI